MPRQGRLLEVLAASLEKLLAPQGVNVQSPEIFYKPIKGIRRKIGEIDITLRTKSTFTGIECRDRPQQGTQWLIEIAGKQKLLDVDTMTAVSTTGFTEEAIDAAAQLSIELMVLRDLSNESLSHWIQPAGFEFDLVDYEILPNIELVPKRKVQKLSQITIDINKRFIKLTNQPKRLALRQYLDINADLKNALLNFSKNSKNDETTVLIISEDDARVTLPNRRLDVKEIRVPVRIFRQIVKTEVLMQTYKNIVTGSINGVQGIARLPMKNGEIKAIISQKQNPDGKGIEQRIDYVDTDSKPIRFIRSETKLTNVDTNEVSLLPENQELIK